MPDEIARPSPDPLAFVVKNGSKILPRTSGAMPAPVSETVMVTPVSVRVQPFSSSQVVPLAAVGFEHCPVPGSQVPSAWHWSAVVHTTAVGTLEGAHPCHRRERFAVSC